MSSAMAPPSPRPAMRQPRWYTIDGGESYGRQVALPETPKQTPSDVSFDSPPMSVVVIQSTPLDLKSDQNRFTDTFSESPFHGSQLMPRRPLPVTCVSPQTTDRKRRASSIASSSVEDSSTTFTSPARAGPRLPSLPISSVTPSRESSRCSARPQHTPKDVDFIALESLSIQSPVGRKPCTASTPSPPNKPRVRGRGNSFSDYIASPARSMQSSFSDYVGSPSFKPSTASLDPSLEGAGAGQTPSAARKVRLKVIAQNDNATKRTFSEPSKFSSPVLSLACKRQSSTSLAYSMDGSEYSNENVPSPPSKTRLPVLGDIDHPIFPLNHEVMVTPRKIDQPHYSPQKMPSKITLLSPRTPLPKMRLTPRKSPDSKTNFGLKPRKPLQHLRSPLSAKGSVFGNDSSDEPLSFDASLSGCNQDPSASSKASKSTYNVSPRALFPPPGSQFFPPNHNKSSNIAGMDVSFNNHSFEESVAESCRSNMSYMSDSDDEDAFVLASPAVIEKEAARHRNRCDDAGKRLTKLPRR